MTSEQLNPPNIQPVLSKDVFGKVSAGVFVKVLPKTPAKGLYTAKAKSAERLIDKACSAFVVLLERPQHKLEIHQASSAKPMFRGLGVRSCLA